MSELLQAIEKSYGILGLLIVAPFVAVYYQWNELKRLQSDRLADNKQFTSIIVDMNDKAIRAHELRVTDLQAINSTLIGLVRESSASAKETNLSLERVGDLLTQHQKD